MSKRKDSNAVDITPEEMAKLDEMKADGVRLAELMNAPKTKESVAEMRKLLAKAKVDAKSMKRFETFPPRKRKPTK